MRLGEMHHDGLAVVKDKWSVKLYPYNRSINNTTTASKTIVEFGNIVKTKPWGVL